MALDLPPVEIRNGRFNPSEILAGMNFRSVYLPVFRNAIPDALEVFDFADPNMVSGGRDVTTVSAAGAFLLNNKFVTAHAQCDWRIAWRHRRLRMIRRGLIWRTN